VNDPADPTSQEASDPLAEAARRQHARQEHWRREGEPSLMRQVGQIGMLGWMIVTPALLFLFLGRWIDREAGTGIFWTAPLLLLGLAAGCWSAWRWMHKQ
jgi:ATP synthase protein I